MEGEIYILKYIRVRILQNIPILEKVKVKMEARCWRTTCGSFWERRWKFGLSSVCSSCREVETESMYVYKKKLRLANCTSSGGIVLKLKTKRECGGVYCIWGQQCSWAFDQSIMLWHPLGTGGCEQFANGSWISVTGRPRRMAVCLGSGGSWGEGSGRQSWGRWPPVTVRRGHSWQIQGWNNELY